MDAKRVTIGSLFSGIGGLELGLEWAGLGPTVWQVESDAFCRSVLAGHWPAAVRFDDVRDVGADDLAPVDIVCGGFPCQDVSGAGKGEGLAGSRSGLWREFDRVVGLLAPEWVVVENVASGAKRWVDAVAGALGQRGYETLPIPLSAEAVGAPHRRQRIFLVARRVSDAVGEPQRQQQQRLAEGWPPRGVRNGGPRQPGHVGDKVADPHEDRREAKRRGRLFDGQRPAFGYDTYGSSGAWPWPPGPGDTEGWAGYLAQGGPQPGLRRGADGFPCGMARAEWQDRLRALGNAVVPQCAEVVGWVIRELSEGA